MGCKYACTCGRLCGGCLIYQPEKYYGHAEDIMAQAKGYRDADEMEAEWERQREQQREQDIAAEQPFSD